MQTKQHLPKSITDVAIPRRVNASMTTLSDGSTVYWVAGVSGVQIRSRPFTNASAFARYIRRNYNKVQA